jgi:hypothetical protein
MPPSKSTVSRATALADPNAANAEVNKALNGAGVSDIPKAPEPEDGFVRLPAGLVRNGEVTRTAIVRELNGMDEEALSKAMKVGNPIHFTDVLVSRATETLGNEPATKEDLKNLLIGDRDELVLAIRIATYGETLSIDQWTCPHCKAVTPISFSLKDDIERVRLENPAEEMVFEVELRKGAKAKVRLPNGSDQEYMFENPEWTTAQRTSRMLTRCVMTYTDPTGHTFQVVAMPSIVLGLSIPDRQKIVMEISKRQPGPQYNGVKFTHTECGNEVVLALGVADMFRELINFL